MFEVGGHHPVLHICPSSALLCILCGFNLGTMVAFVLFSVGSWPCRAGIKSEPWRRINLDVIMNEILSSG